MLNARYDQCPICDDLVRLTPGDRVAVLLDCDGKAIGVDCTMCNGWRDVDDCTQVHDGLDELLAIMRGATPE